MSETRFNALLHLAYFTVGVGGCIVLVALIGADALLPVAVVAVVGFLAAFVRWMLDN